MFKSYFTKNLKEDEEVIRIVRIYPLALINQIVVSLFFILLAFFLMFILFRQGTWGIILFSLLLAFGVIYGVRQWIIWSLNGIVVTSKRIIDFDQKGFFDRTVSESSLDKIQDVSYEIKGPSQTMLNYGSVKLQTASTTPVLEIHRVHQPHKLQQLITETQQRYARGEFDKKDEGEMSATELLEVVRQIRAEIGEEEFAKILKKRKE